LDARSVLLSQINWKFFKTIENEIIENSKNTIKLAPDLANPPTNIIGSGELLELS
jgi:hypothetical protein